MVIEPHTSHNNAANYHLSLPAVDRCFLCVSVSERALD